MRKVSLILLLLMSCALAFAQTQSAVTGPPPTPSIHPNTTESSPMMLTKKDAPGRERSTSMEVNTVADNLANETSYSQFFKAVQKAELTETFKSAGPITIFLPDNAAFAKMPKGKLDTLMRDDHQLELVAFITYHVIPGKLNAKKLASEIAKQKKTGGFKTISGAHLNAKLDAAHNIVLVDEYGGEATIIKSNIKQSNGMMFIISDVLISKNHMI